VYSTEFYKQKEGYLGKCMNKTIKKKIKCITERTSVTIKTPFAVVILKVPRFK
jgi:hypothetical protein